MSQSIKILLISIIAGGTFGFLSVSNDQNTKEISQAIGIGVTMTSSTYALLRSLKDTDE
ncbi:hypothetical protein [Okeania sp. SIO1I7]|uniref:hypothetical protein n=1 Tax=Okeania sp. SIO1I7 TaxID=2607772 RepID=UPI0013FC0372|nr:hypothetical protein [Okeania sp. SIO1I7]NET29742.1 hypothetical protein [Okeania sp. SIO1I7]